MLLARTSPERPVSLRSAAAFADQPEQQRYRLMQILLITYIFLLVSRSFEALALVGLGRLYLMMILSAASLAVLALNGNLIRAARTTCGILLISFTIWSMLILPFSSWKSESLATLSYWSKSFAAFFIVAGLASVFDTTRKMFTALGWAAIGALLIIAIPGRLGGDRFVAFGSMGNSNEVAFHLMFDLPFLLFLLSRSKLIFKVPILACALLSVVLSLKTASRAGLLMAGAMIIVSLIRLSLASKFKILLIAAIGGAIGFSTIDQAALDRFKTLIHSDDTSTMAAASAKESADVRKYKLQQGIEMTVSHPIFGVGMGVFTPASWELSLEHGEKPYWIAAHNSYIQISSETGLVGLGLILAVFATCARGMLRLNSAARRLKLRDLQDMSFCALLSLVVLSIHFFFDSISYEYYVPMFAGLCTALIYTSKPVLAAAENDGALAGGTARNQLITEKPVVSESGPSKSFAPIPGRKLNPYRFGRRRALPGK